MTTIKYKKSKREQSRSYSEFAFERYNKLGRCIAIERNGRSFGLDSSLRSDRTDRTLGRYIATELEPKLNRAWLELGRYVATERNGRSVFT
ncbi:hypothetical protein F2Q69_00012951 [Brassica cretica]|uniref:Uncharacterized protein n=1 Tax=Brassica cretica TaxID=69181 RepID=A0A8S9QQB3_BRACR|nr:hypothetical protein F2Q69_00012951 [Brassica cretica]